MTDETLDDRDGDLEGTHVDGVGETADTPPCVLVTSPPRPQHGLPTSPTQGTATVAGMTTGRAVLTATHLGVVSATRPLPQREMATTTGHTTASTIPTTTTTTTTTSLPTS